MQTLNIKKMLDIAETVAKSAATKLLQKEELLKRVDCDFPRDVKVKADKFLDEIIREQLEKETDFPIISEETVDSQKMGDGYQWIVDPLDGSLNFSRSIPTCCISIALWKGLEPLLGVIYDFNRDECFVGLVDSKCELNKKIIKPSNVKEKYNAILATGFPIRTDFKQNSLLNFVIDIQQFKKIRLFGSAALSLAYVACGRVDFYHENNIKIWDVAAGLALIKSVGGVVQFTQPKSDMTLIVKASNPYILK